MGRSIPGNYESWERGGCGVCDEQDMHSKNSSKSSDLSNLATRSIINVTSTMSVHQQLWSGAWGGMEHWGEGGGGVGGEHGLPNELTPTTDTTTATATGTATTTTASTNHCQQIVLELTTNRPQCGSQTQGR
jgi:hypothetical protein